MTMQSQTPADTGIGTAVGRTLNTVPTGGGVKTFIVSLY